MPVKKTIEAIINGEPERVNVPLDSIVFNPYLANVRHEVYRLIIGGVLPVTPVLIRQGDGYAFEDFEV